MDRITLTGNKRAIIRQDLPEGEPEQDEFLFVYSNGRQYTFDPASLWLLVSKVQQFEETEGCSLLYQAVERLNQKGKEHNFDFVRYRNYCVFGDLSSATLLNREALRVCVGAFNRDTESQLEHLIDLVVFAMLHWGLLSEFRGTGFEVKARRD
jgi:hypothetical protein